MNGQHVRLGMMSTPDFLKTLPAKMNNNARGRQEKREYVFGDVKYSLNISSKRYKLFRKSSKCACCGVNGVVVFLERHAKDTTPHFNLYTEDGVLMTKDHIVPRSLGGTNDLTNLQTMCLSCNQKKGNRNITNEELRKEIFR